MSEAPFSPGDEVIVTTTSWRRVFTVESSNSHRTMVTGPRGAARVLVLGGDGQWSLFAYGRDRARSRPCSVETVPTPAELAKSRLGAIAREHMDYLQSIHADEARRETSGRVYFAAGLDFAAAVRRETNAIADMLIRKNAAYGNSALDPVRIFSQADPVEQIRVRIDDKLSRLQRGTGDDEDTVGDLIGYLVLLRIAEGDR